MSTKFRQVTNCFNISLEDSSDKYSPSNSLLNSSSTRNFAILCGVFSILPFSIKKSIP